MSPAETSLETAPKQNNQLNTAQVQPLRQYNNHMDTLEKVKNVLVEQLGCGLEDLAPETQISYDLGANSLDRMEILMTLEKEFSVKFPKSSWPEANTIQGLVTLVEAHLSE
jgi:acyl carrier protein